MRCNMTWEELKEEAKKMGALIISASSTTPEHIWLGDYLCFYKNGRILFCASNRQNTRPNARHNESTTIGGG